MATNEDAATQGPERARTETKRFSSDQPSSPIAGLKAMGGAARRLFGNWRALLALLVLYAVLIASLYFFIAIREASIWQVLATFLLAALAPVLFFIIQTIGVRYVENGLRTRDLLRSSLRDFWILMVATLPLLLLAWLIAYLFGKFQVDVSPVVSEAGRAGVEGGAAGTAVARPPAQVAISWKEIALTTLRFLVLYLILPLVAIHLWISAARLGLGGAFKNIKRVLARALAPGAVLVYVLGMLIFGVIPYLLITTNFSRGGAWTEISLLGGRLLLASLFMLIGWIITTGALSILSPEPAREVAVTEPTDTVATDNSGVE